MVYFMTLLPAKRIIPDTITALTGIVGTFALYAFFHGERDLAVRLLILALLLDVLDGMVARGLGIADKQGELLDRLFDRYYQVIVPAIIYAHYNNWSYDATLYAGLVITISLWRVTRRVRARLYFVGAPLFLHTIAILTSLYAEKPAPTYVLIMLSIASLLPLKYYRRNPRYSEKENKGTHAAARIAILALMALLPYERLSLALGVVHYMAIVYGLLGWAYYLYAEKGTLLNRVLYRERVEGY